MRARRLRESGLRGESKAPWISKAKSEQLGFGKRTRTRGLDSIHRYRISKDDMHICTMDYGTRTDQPLSLRNTKIYSERIPIPSVNTYPALSLLVDVEARVRYGDERSISYPNATTPTCTICHRQVRAYCVYTVVYYSLRSILSGASQDNTISYITL